ncbi:MAG: hypothetical protein QOE36_2676 [Gaiellaceae bacterium]|jgi:multisubunit Na+/H+ antiporter MnhE subunit|nr:hypothetical protein [Gaiellaceae bacterium]
MRRALSFLAWWAVLFLLWLLYVGTLDSQEVIAGAALSAVAATGAEVVRSLGLLQFRVRRRWLVRAWRPLVHVVPEFLLLLAALWRAVARGERAPGRFTVLEFPAGGARAEDAGRRAFVTTIGSLAPNSYVVDVDPETGLLLEHVLVPRRTSKLPL